METKETKQLQTKNCPTRAKEESDGQTLLATTTYPTQISNADVGGISKIFKDTFDFLMVRNFLYRDALFRYLFY